jgi:hypothetical protein
VDGGLPITPPRILTASAVPALAITGYLLTGCPSGSAFDVSATIIDENSEEQVEVRWFVDYDPDNQIFRTPVFTETLPPPTDSTQYRRYPKGLSFSPWDYTPYTGGVHVVEMTISNGFLPINAAVPAGSLPNRTPAPGYEVQVFRWTFEPAPTGGCGP